MRFTNNKRRTKGVVAAAKNNATKDYQVKLKAYYENLLTKTREEVVAIRIGLAPRFKNYINLCLEVEKLLFNKELMELKKEQ